MMKFEKKKKNEGSNSLGVGKSKAPEREREKSSRWPAAGESVMWAERICRSKARVRYRHRLVVRVYDDAGDVSVRTEALSPSRALEKALIHVRADVNAWWVAVPDAGFI